MDDSKVIEVDDITLGDCEQLFINNGTTVELSNGRITNLNTKDGGLL